MSEDTNNEPTKIVVVSSDFSRDFYIPKSKAKAFYDAGIISKGVDCMFDYMLQRCKDCLFENCKGGGRCTHNCHHYNKVHAEKVEAPSFKRPRGSKNKAKRKREESIESTRKALNWTKGAQFCPIGSIKVEAGMLGIVLQFTGVTQHGQVFLVDASQANAGWAMSIIIDGTQRGTYESQTSDLRAAVIDAVERLS